MTYTPKPQPFRQGEVFLPLLVLGAVVLFCVHLWRGLYVDEYTSWSVTGQAAGDLVRNRLHAGHFPAYFLFLKIWRCAGDSELALRLPSVLMMVGAVWVFARLSEDLFDRKTARLATIFCVVHQLTVWTAQTARPYAGMFLFGVLMAWGLARWWKTGRSRWLFLVFFASGLGFSFQAAFALTVAALAAACVWSARGGARRRAWAGLAAMALPVALQGVLVWCLAESQRNYGVVEAKFRIKQAFNGVGHVFLGDYSFWTRDWFLYAAWAVVVACLWGACQFLKSETNRSPEEPACSKHSSEFKPQPDDRTSLRFRAAMVWCWAGMPLLLLFLADSFLARKSVLSHERYYVPALGGLLLLLAVGTRHWMRSRWFSRRAWVPPALVLLLLLSCTLGWLAQRGDGPKTLAREMRRIYPPKAIAGYKAGFEYEFRRDRGVRFVDLTGAPAEEAEKRLSALRGTGSVWLVVYNNKKDALDVFLKNPPRGFRIVERTGAIVGKTSPARLAAADARAVLLEPIAP